MPRISEVNNQRICFYVTDEILEKITELAKKSRMSLSQYVRIIVIEMIENEDS